MKKQLVILLSTIIVLTLCGCSSSDSSERNKTSNKKSTTETSKPTTSASKQTKEPQEDSNADLPDDFKVATQVELASLPNLEELVSTTTDALLNMGVTGLNGNATFGNYSDDSIESVAIYNIEAFTTTDTGKHLITSLLYTKTESSSGNWLVNSVDDADTNQCYYIDGSSKDYVDLYDYKTGNLISSKTKSWDESDPMDEFNKKMDEIDKEQENKLNDIKEKYNIQ